MTQQQCNCSPETFYGLNLTRSVVVSARMDSDDYWHMNSGQSSGLDRKKRWDAKTF
jgi:hypothetical protein